MLVESIVTFILVACLSNFVEWFVHKYILHGLGKSKTSFFHYHWTHHFRCRKNNNIDEQVYSKKVYNNLKRKDVWKELFGLVLIVSFNTIWLFIWPMLFYFITFWTIVYFVLHYSCHAFPEWGKKWMRWHYDHHMGKNQDANWGVSFPLMDYIMGTRIKYEYDVNGKCLSEKK